MIDQTIQYIVRELNNDLNSSPTDDFVIPENIARLDTTTDPGVDGLQTKVVLTLVNIEEEKTLKNNPNYIKENQTVRKFQPVLFLNLYLLFSCADSRYGEALTKISRLIGFFQRQNSFDAQTANVDFPVGLEKVTLDLYSLSMEQSNHLWGILGSKYMPSVLYKMRLTPIQETLPTAADVVETVEVFSKIKPQFS